LSERIKHLEEKVAYLEHHVSQQDKAMLELVENLDRLRQELRTLRERPVRSGLAEAVGEERASERPPHY
jgi:SlyX protein